MAEENPVDGEPHKQFLARFNTTEEPSCAGKRKGSDDGWSGGGYVKIKNQKLETQNKEYEKISDIFTGVSIWVNGYTYPSSDELRRLICQHGGKYKHYFSKTHVTHIIATNLPDGKIRNLKNRDKVMHPDWIVDSVKEGKLLNEDRYLIYSAAKRDGIVIDFNPKQAHKVAAYCADATNTNGKPVFNNGEDNNDSCEKFNLYNSDEEDNFSGDSLDHKLEDGDTPCLSTHTYSKSSASKHMLKAGDKNYIEEFYAHSRLHHLSMWKAELKKFAASIQEKWSAKKKKKLTTRKSGKVIMHVDLDSFFASVAMKSNPELKGMPIAVCHSSGANQTGSNSWSEIASCSYEARRFGLHNGMLLKDAKRDCPQLVCVPYQFEEYCEVSQKFYEIISKFTYQVQAVSCDEVLLDISGLISPDIEILDLADTIRSEIYNATQCTASCGIGNSILIARLATKCAKPDGRYYVRDEDISNFILQQNVKDLPGVGYRTHNKLNTLGIKTCADLQKWHLSSLQKEFGKKFGNMLYKFSRGIDERQIKTLNEIKSVSAEINYGMRFTSDEDVEKFVKDLSIEVERRMKDNKKKGKQLTLKIMAAQKDAANPSKYMGHGICDSMSKSYQLPCATDDHKIIGGTCIGIMRSLKISAENYRGIGIQISKLANELCDSSNATGLIQFAKPVTSKELFESEESSRIHHNFQETLNASPKKNLTIDKFIITPSESQDKNDLTHFPRLPSVILETSDSSVTAKSSEPRTTSLNWDPEVLAELPDFIRLELLKHQSDVSRTTISDKINLHNISTCHMIKKRKNTRGPISKRSPSKRKQNTSKKLPEKSKFKIDQHLLPKKHGLTADSISLGHVEVIDNLPKCTNVICTEVGKTDAPANSCNMHNKNDLLTINCNYNITNTNVFHNSLLLSPSQMDQSVLQALPPDVRDDVMNNVKRMRNNCSTVKTSDFHEKNKNLDCQYSTGATSISSNNSTNQFTPSLVSDNKNIGILSKSEVSLLPEIETSVNPDNTSRNSMIIDSLLLSPSQMDQSVLQALPPDIRNDVINDAKNKKAKSKLVNTSVVNKSNLDCKVSTEVTTIPKNCTAHSESELVLEPIRETSSTSKSGNNIPCNNIRDSLLLSPSQMDQSVLQALPQDVRDDIINESKRLRNQHSSINTIEVSTNSAEMTIANKTSYTNVCPKLYLANEPTSSKISGSTVSNSGLKENSLLLTTHQTDSITSVSNTPVVRSTPSIQIAGMGNLVSDLNLSVLNSLSNELKNEILKDLGNTRNESRTELAGQSEGNPIKKTTTNKSAQLLSPSQIDKDVLEVLPPSIQQEVVMAAKLQKQKQIRLKENELQLQQQRDHMNMLDDTNVLKYVRLKQNMPVLCGASTFNEVKKVLRNWVKTHPEPLAEDINDVIDYFHQLLVTYNMESLYSFVLFLRRIMSSNTSWYTAFNEILNSVQVNVKSSYSGAFPVQPLFSTP